MRKDHGLSLRPLLLQRKGVSRDTLVRPLVCERCGEKPARDAHRHNGYDPDHWLDVVWVCVKCHRHEHSEQFAEISRRNRGEGNGQAKLNTPDVLRILDLYRNGHSGAEIASMYKLSRNTIYDILAGRSWQNTTKDPPLVPDVESEIASANTV